MLMEREVSSWIPKENRMRSVLFVYLIGILLAGTHGTPDYCTLPYDRGNCSEVLYHYYFSPEHSKCLMFLYGGCEGNENNFENLYTCMRQCSGKYPDEEVTEAIVDADSSNGNGDGDSPTVSSELEVITQRTVSPFLVLANGSGQTTFTFASSASYIQIGPEEISRYQIRNRRSVSLEFRTRLPHALLVYHGIRNRPNTMNKYELYVMLDQGQLKIKHLFGDFSTTLEVGKGLNRDKWHTVNVVIDPSERVISATVDDHEKILTIDGLKERPLYGADNEELESVIFIGGLSADDERVDISYFANPLVGCMRNVILETSPLKTAALEPIRPLFSSVYKNVDENCRNKCWEMTVKCSRDSRCINHYDHVECDCFQARFKGEKCKDTNISLLSLNGYSYVTFTVYEWMDRVHSDANRISMRFMTYMDDSILFYAAGEIPYHNHIAASIMNHSIYADIDFGDGEQIQVQMARKVTDGKWHTLTIFHIGNNVTIQLDHHLKSYIINGSNQHLYVDPDIYVGGGGPILKHREGLKSSNNFVGCLQEVYFNSKSVLYELQETNHQARHHGLTPPVFEKECKPQQTVPITIPFASSGFRVSNPNPEELHLRFAFRTDELFGTMAYSEIRTLQGSGFWELKFSVDRITFEYQPDMTLVDISTAKFIFVNYKKRKTQWFTVELTYSNGEVTLSCDGQTAKADLNVLQLSPIITLGTSVHSPQSGFMGCMRRVEIGGKFIDARQIVGSVDDQIGDIALDNCQFMDPCKRPDVCEHGGRCEVVKGQLTCDCGDSGYTGKHCHFAIFKRTCEELALLGFTESGVYKIDIDGNGPYPPSHVKCKFETDATGETKTIVEHNLPREQDVWLPSLKENNTDFKVDLEYREFTPEMLLSLVSQSVQCSQHIKFDCHKAKLGLHQFTWFKPADPKASRVVSIGDAKRNTCPCYSAGTCAKGEQCNCDSGEDKWLHDEGFFTNPDRLGIMEMNFIHPTDQPSDSSARITLGPLECVEANTQRYVVTFKTFGSYLEAPGWKSGDLAFSFRTTRSSAILLFQPLLHAQHNSFSVFLTNDHELTFRFILNGDAKLVTVRSQRPLSGGDWQQVWIDYDLHQVRFQINREHQMINLPDGQQFGPFEGTMYIAGAPANYLEDIEVQEGLIGCFRGLVMNGQVVDLYSYMKFHKADIIKDCSPSCDPNPCKNSASCQENWGSFTCQCKNPWAHSGPLCDTDINTDGLTFLSQSSYIKRQSKGAEVDPVKNILTSDIFLNLRTYDEDALVLYANDNLNNFVQLHLEEGTDVIFTWNDGHFIHKISVRQKRLNHGDPIQIAVVRNLSHTILHVNEETATETYGVSLLTEYSENPWVNPEVEIFTPPRPFAPASSYYQLFLGGFDNSAVKPAKNISRIPGMLGCLRGFKIGKEQIEISNMANRNDVLEGCKMVCDSKPCSNGGICMEDFQSRKYSCDCTFTSYYGQRCEEERGATFQGESFIRRRFSNPKESVASIQARFGFSSTYAGEETVLLTVQIPGQSYSLLFAINAQGHLILNETIDKITTGATVLYQHFVDGSRHSVYYKRDPEETLLIVDQEEIAVSLLDSKTQMKFKLIPEQNLNVGEIFVGGVNEAVPALKTFRRFKGCLSNIYVELSKEELRPMDEYMGFLKKPPELLLDVEKTEGIKLGTCGAFFAFKPPQAKTNELLPTGVADWRNTIPKKVRIYLRKSEEPDAAGISIHTLALIFGVFLLTIILCVAMYAYKLNKRYKRRKYLEDDDDDDYPPHRGQAMRYYDPSSSEMKYVAYRQTDPDKVNLVSNNSKPHNNYANNTNGNVHSPTGESDVDEKPEDDDGSSEDTTSQNPSEDDSGSSGSDDQNIDDKGGNDSDYGEASGGDRNYVLDPLLPEIIAEEDEDRVKEAGDDDDDTIKIVKKPFRPKGAVSPVFVSESARTFESSPIAIIGGARYQNLKRTSKDSILSLD